MYGNVFISVFTFNGSQDAELEMYTDARRPTIERQPIELLRRPDVRSIGTGNMIYILLALKTVDTNFAAVVNYKTYTFYCSPLLLYLLRMICISL